MLAEILANPVAWPLWGVFLFAATMFPLGFLLPGCVCCGGGNCTQCGSFLYPQGTSQNASGRMCCTGTIATSVTLRITNVGSATSSYIARGAGSTYTKITSTFACSTIDGDYVVPLSRTMGSDSAACEWSLDTYETCQTQAAFTLTPYTASIDPSSMSGTPQSYPTWFLTLTQIKKTISGTVRIQTCSGYPDFETCNIGSTRTSSAWLMIRLQSTPFPKSMFTVEACSPSGVVLETNQRMQVSQNCDSGFAFGPYDTGCEFRLELV